MRYWAREEDDFLRESATEMSFKDIGDVLGRSRGAVCGRAAYLKVSAGRPSGSPPWPDSEVLVLRQLAGSFEYKAIADYLGRTTSQVRRKAHDLGLKGLPKNHWRAETHWSWTGEQATYRAVHLRLRAARGPASLFQCRFCGDPAYHWAYDHSEPNPRRDEETGRLYTTDLSRYMTLCPPCHLRMDRSILPLTF